MAKDLVDISTGELFDVPFVRNPYNYDAGSVSRETGLVCHDLSLAVQDQAEEVDINTIVRRFGLTGKLPDNVVAPTYGDFTGVTDYQTALNAVIEADEAFMKMPADVRARFNNDPGAFVDFCSDGRNREEAEKLGLIVRPALPGQTAQEASSDVQASQAS